MPDADTAEVIVLLDGDGGAARTRARTATSSRSRRSTRRAASRASCPAAAASRSPGDVGAGLDRMAAAHRRPSWSGVAQRVMEMAVEYARDRKQFDRPIGAYQAVSHRCADMLRETESARSATLWAAWAAEAEPETLPLAAVDGEGAGLRRRLERDLRRRSRCTAASASPGSTTCTSSSSGPRSDGSLFGSAPRAPRPRGRDLSGLRAAATRLAIGS